MINTKKILEAVIDGVEDKKAHDVIALDIQEISLVADYFVICTGRSDTQVLAIANEVKKVAHKLGLPVKGVEGERTARWVLVDIGDVVVHIFHHEERDYYNMEKIWTDAKVVNV